MKYWRELTTGIYPWDMHDEGIEAILDNLQQHAGCNAAYMLGVMHHEKRPLHDNYYHHNPKRKRYLVEDSRAYWKPDPANYKGSRIKPLTSDRDFLKGTDWLELFCKSLRKRGMKPGVEISHTPLDKERANGEFADCIQRDIYGNLLRPLVPGQNNTHAGQLMCWNSPDARAYVSALMVDLASRYDVDMIQACTYLYFDGFPKLHPLLGVTLGGCFCDNCAREAKKQGLDWEAIRQVVRRFADIMMRKSLENNEDYMLIERSDASEATFLLENPELYQWLKFRCDSTTRYFKEISEAVHKANPKIDLRYNTCWPRPDHVGQDFTKSAQYLDSIRLMDYAEQSGDEEKVRNKYRWLSNIRRQVGEDKPLIAAIAPRAKATPELIKIGIRTVSLAGCDGLSFGFYDGATIERLEAIKQGMAEAEVAVKTG